MYKEYREIRLKLEPIRMPEYLKHGVSPIGLKKRLKPTLQDKLASFNKSRIERNA